MAVNFNHLSNLCRKLPDEQETVLLPPSTFEVTTPAIDPWRALAKATGEILDLKQQNTKLKEDKHITFPVGEEIKARVDLHQHGNPPTVQSAHRPEYIELSHYHDIINRQAAELAELRKQVAMVTASCDKQVNKQESDLLLRDTEHGHKMTSLQEKLQSTAELLENERHRFEQSEMKWKEDHMTLSAQCRQEVELKERLHGERVQSLEGQLSEIKAKDSAADEELNRKLKEYETTVQEQRESLAQMKTYQAETQNTTKSTEIWKKDLENIKQKLEAKESQRAKLESEVDLVNIRLNSQNEMFIIQERELSKVKDGSSDKKKQCLLTRWREKVFELLLQNQMAEIVQRDQERQWKNKVYDLETSLEGHAAQCQLLQCSLQDRQAQLDMEHNTVMTLQQELTRAQELAINLDDKNKMDAQIIQQLAVYVKSLSDQVAEMELAQAFALSLLISYNQRITFASGRVEILQSQFARKEALIRLEMEEAFNDRPTTDREQVEPTLDSTSMPELERELVSVTEERDALSAQIRSDARLLEKKVLAARQKVSEEVSLLKDRTEELHAALEDKTKSCESLTDEVTKLQGEQEETKETVDLLKTQLAKAQLQAKADVEEVRKTEQTEFTEQLASLEHKLNEARREHTKAVVSLRQLERQCVRDKERHTGHVHTLEQHYTAEINKLQDKWRATEKDKNLLMATLRQEGILGKVKFERPAPHLLKEEIDHSHAVEPVLGEQSTELPTRDTGLYPSEDTTHFTPQAPSTGLRLSSSDSEEPLHAVIDDLKSLAQAVLSDGEDGSSSEEHMDRSDRVEDVY